MLLNDTIRLQVNFKHFNGQLVDPTDIKLIIYDKDKKIVEEIPIDDTNKQKVGVYFYDYVLSDKLTDYFYFEFSGSYNNKPILARDKVEIKFI
jgi:hypothetical protein